MKNKKVLFFCLFFMFFLTSHLGFLAFSSLLYLLNEDFSWSLFVELFHPWFWKFFIFWCLFCCLCASVIKKVYGYTYKKMIKIMISVFFVSFALSLILASDLLPFGYLLILSGLISSIVAVLVKRFYFYEQKRHS